MISKRRHLWQVLHEKLLRFVINKIRDLFCMKIQHYCLCALRVCVCVCVCVRARARVVYIYIYTHTYIHTYIYKHTTNKLEFLWHWFVYIILDSYTRSLRLFYPCGIGYCFSHCLQQYIRNTQWTFPLISHLNNL